MFYNTTNSKHARSEFIKAKKAAEIAYWEAGEAQCYNSPEQAKLKNDFYALEKKAKKAESLMWHCSCIESVAMRYRPSIG